jgi:RNase H-fold protein (predicted Holliday junction resolvase)
MFVPMAADDTITEILRTAHESVAAAGVPAELRQVAFDKALELAAAGVVRSSPTQTISSASQQQKAAPPASADTKTIAKIAKELKVDEVTVGEVFHMDGRHACAQHRHRPA